MDEVLRSSDGRAGFLSFALLCFAILVFFTISILGRARERRRVETLQARLEHQVALLERRRAELVRQKRGLLRDPVFIEGEIRRQLGFRRPGEVAYTRLRLPVQRIRTRVDADRSFLDAMMSGVPSAIRQWRIPIVATLVLGMVAIALFGSGSGAAREWAP